MKLTPQEQEALSHLRGVCSVYSKPFLQILTRLSGLDKPLCEIGSPLNYQQMNPDTCPLAIAVITAEGLSAIGDEQPETNHSHKHVPEATHANAQ